MAGSEETAAGGVKHERISVVGVEQSAGWLRCC